MTDSGRAKPDWQLTSRYDFFLVASTKRSVSLPISSKMGHYDDAVQRLLKRFVNRVQSWQTVLISTGVGLMNKAFSHKSPLLEFNDRETLIERDEHDGYRFLAVGLTQALRNVLTHHDNYGLEAVPALEWMAFISAMHRRLDQAQQIPQDSSTSMTPRTDAN